MARIAGIKYETDTKGRRTRLNIDLRKTGKYNFIEELQDYLDVLESEGEPSISGVEFERKQYAKRGIRL
jgi:hypothetical protein